MGDSAVGPDGSAESESCLLEKWFEELNKDVDKWFVEGHDASIIMKKLDKKRDLIRRKMAMIDMAVEKGITDKDRLLVEQADDPDREEEMTKREKVAAAEAWLRQRIGARGPGGKPWPMWTSTSQLTRFCIHGKAVEGLDLGTFSDTSSFSGFLATMTIANLGQENLTIWCKDIDIANVTTLCGWLDAVGALIVLLAAKWFEYVEVPRGKKETLTLVPTPDDYTVVVHNLPPQAHPSACQNPSASSAEVYRAELKSHFERLLSAEVVAPRKGMRVYSTKDSDGCRKSSWSRSRRFSQCVQHKGKVVSVQGTSVKVKWDKGQGPEEDPIEMDQLRDMKVRKRLELFHINPTNHNEGGPVYQVHLVHDYGGEVLRLSREWAAAESSRGRQDEKKKAFWDMVREKSLLDDRPVILAFVVFRHPSYKQFIVDEYRLSSLPMARYLQPRMLNFQGTPIQVEVAENPSDILWTNLDISSRESWRHCVVTVGVFAVAIAACLLVMSWAKNAAQDALPQTGSCGPDVTCTVGGGGSAADQCVCAACGYQGVWNDHPTGIWEECKEWWNAQQKAAFWSSMSGVLITVLNFFGKDLITRLSVSTRQKTLTLQEHLTVYMSTVLCFLTLGFTTALVNWKAEGVYIGGPGFLGIFGNGEYDDTHAEWFVMVGGQIVKIFLMSVSFLPLYAFTPYALGCLRWIRRGRLKSWQELKKLYTPPQFTMAVMQALQLSHILAAMMGSSGMPFMSITLVLAVFGQHWVDKLVLLRGSDVPPMYTEHLAVGMAWWVYFAVWVHSVAAIWMLGNNEVFPSRDSASSASVAKEWMDSLTGDAVFAGRMVQSAAIPNTLLLLGLTALFLSRLLAFLLGGGLLADLTLAVSQGCCRGRSVDGVDDRQTVDQAEKEWDMRQIKHCYEMSELKEFAFLKPSAAAGDKVSRAKNKLKDIRSMALTKSAMGDASAVAASDAVKPAPAADGEFAGPSQVARRGPSSDLPSVLLRLFTYQHCRLLHIRRGGGARPAGRGAAGADRAVGSGGAEGEGEEGKTGDRRQRWRVGRWGAQGRPVLGRGEAEQEEKGQAGRWPWHSKCICFSRRDRRRGQHGNASTRAPAGGSRGTPNISEGEGEAQSQKGAMSPRSRSEFTGM
ncbi:unnamed protein product [Prorocentrum cordatum]|uniref:CSC1/OSCA1-like cytosolic domain-containing protein n=1 Tax=Prorocentrum cordatum TaxID=2364126 RepID=A0ABN9YAI1_9DINO|nr:unnamed protein product [Polarella glacialis]